MINSKQPLILVSNDDGINAKGIAALVEVAKQFGQVLVVAPEQGQSGMSHAITSAVPIRVRLVKEEANATSRRAPKRRVIGESVTMTLISRGGKCTYTTSDIWSLRSKAR